MLNFVSGYAQHVGMHDWAVKRPEPDSEVIVLAMTSVNGVKSWRGVEAMRGFYSTWTQSQNVTGSPLGLRSKTLTSEAREAFLAAQTQCKIPAFFINPRTQFTGEICEGVIEADALDGTWWISIEELHKSPVTKESLFDLQRPRTKAAIRYNGKFFSIDDVLDSEVSIVKG